MSRSGRPGSSRATTRKPRLSTKRWHRWPRGCARSACCCIRTCPTASRSCCSRSALRSSRTTARCSQSAATGCRCSLSSRCSPSARSVVDSHTHLEMCDPPDAELVASALEAGVSRIVTIGIDGASCRAALAAAEDFPQVYAAVGRHPNSASGFDDADLAELAALAAHPKCVAIGETGLDYYRDYAPREDQRRAFRAQIGLARDVGKPLIIHTRAADDDTLSFLASEAAGVRVILHCFSMADRIEECLEHEDWWISFAGNVTYPKAGALRLAALRVPVGRLLVETDAPYLSPQAVRGKPNEPAFVVHTARAVALERRVGYEELEAALEL